MVGLEVTPTTCRSRIRSARFPVASRSRLMSSSHTATPAEESCARTSSGCGVMATAPCRSDTLSILAAPGRPGQTRTGRGCHPLRRDPELLVQHLVVGGGTEVLQADAFAGVTGECPPAQCDARFDTDPRPDPRRKHLLLVGGLPRGEPFNARHRDHPGRYALTREQLACRERDLDLAAGGDEDHRRLPASGLGQDVPAAGSTLG